MCIRYLEESFQIKIQLDTVIINIILYIISEEMVNEIVKAAGKISEKTIIGTFKHSLKFIEKEIYKNDYPIN